MNRPSGSAWYFQRQVVEGRVLAEHHVEPVVDRTLVALAEGAISAPGRLKSTPICPAAPLWPDLRRAERTAPPDARSRPWLRSAGSPGLPSPPNRSAAVPSGDGDHEPEHALAAEIVAGRQQGWARDRGWGKEASCEPTANAEAPREVPLPRAHGHLRQGPGVSGMAPQMGHPGPRRQPGAQPASRGSQQPVGLLEVQEVPLVPRAGHLPRPPGEREQRPAQKADRHGLLGLPDPHPPTHLAAHRSPPAPRRASRPPQPQQGAWGLQVRRRVQPRPGHELRTRNIEAVLEHVEQATHRALTEGNVGVADQEHGTAGRPHPVVDPRRIAAVGLDDQLVGSQLAQGAGLHRVFGVIDQHDLGP